MKYRTDQTAAEVAETLWTEIQQIDNLIKVRLSTYVTAKTSIAAVERRQTGNLVSKDLSPYVRSEDFIRDSEFMLTLLIVVPQVLKMEWEKSYESLAPMVVPRSSRCLAEEEGYCLFNVTLFNKFKVEFIKSATDRQFIVREFHYDPDLYHESLEANEAMQVDLRNQKSSLIRLLKTNFGEMYAAWIHLKVLRLFVESVLRYGLPPEFLCSVLRLHYGDERGERRLRLAFLHVLEQLKLPGISAIDITTAIHSSKDAMTSESVEEAELWQALNMSALDEDPFVKLSLKWPL